MFLPISFSLSVYLRSSGVHFCEIFGKLNLGARNTQLDLKVISLDFLNKNVTRMWANAQRDGRPAKYRWLPLFNAAKFG